MAKFKYLNIWGEDVSDVKSLLSWGVAMLMISPKGLWRR